MCLFVILVFAATAIAFPFIGIIASRGHGQVAEDRVQVDAMGIDALFQSFKMGDGTTQTTHAVFFKYFYGIGPFSTISPILISLLIKEITSLSCKLKGCPKEHYSKNQSCQRLQRLLPLDILHNSIIPLV